MSEDINCVSRYLLSIGQLPTEVNISTIHKRLSRLLGVGYSRKYWELLIKSAAVYISRNEHKPFDLRDYKEQIVLHTRRLIEEQKRINKG